MSTCPAKCSMLQKRSVVGGLSAPMRLGPRPWRRCPPQAAVGEIYAVLCLQTKVPVHSQPAASSLSRRPHTPTATEVQRRNEWSQIAGEVIPGPVHGGRAGSEKALGRQPGTSSCHCKLSYHRRPRPQTAGSGTTQTCSIMRDVVGGCERFISGRSTQPRGVPLARLGGGGKSAEACVPARRSTARRSRLPRRSLAVHSQRYA